MGTFMPNVSKIVLPWSPNAGNDLAGDVCFFVQFSTNSRGYDVSSLLGFLGPLDARSCGCELKCAFIVNLEPSSTQRRGVPYCRA
jgi:hypothetical protein